MDSREKGGGMKSGVRQRKTARVAAFAAMLFAACAVASSQAGNLFFDTVDVRVVNVEVTVTDEEGRPVMDLEPDEFEIFEDGKPVEMTNFFVVEGRRVKSDREGPVESDSLAEQLFYAPETRRLNLILLVDNLNMRPENRNAVFDDVALYLEESLDPRDRVMVVALGRVLEVAQPFTNDPGLLLRTLDDLEMQTSDFLAIETEQRALLRQIQRASLPENPLNSGGAALATDSWEAAQMNADRLARSVEQLAEIRLQRVINTTEALAEFTDSLAGMRGRKAMLYVSDGLPLHPADSLAQAWLNKFDDWIISQDANEALPAWQDMSTIIGSPGFDASRAFERLVERASANGVVFYPLSNARNLLRAGISAEFQSSGTTTGKGAFSQDVNALETLSLESSLLQMAEGTGGVAFTRTPNIEGLLKEVAQDFDSFYSLGFTPASGDGQIHEIDVRVARKGLEVRHVTAHRERDPIDELRDLTLSALHFGLEDNALDVELDPGQAVRSGGKRYQLQVMVKIPFRNVLLLPSDESHVGQLSLIVVVRDQETGGASSPQQIDLPLEIPNDRVVDVIQQYAAYPLQLEIERGRKRIAVGVRDNLARIDSTVNLEVAVGASDEADEPKGGR
jgi:VWFA-related protein